MRFHVMTAHAPLEGVVRVPGDKSISHLAEGTGRIEGFLPSGDCLATLDCVRQLGVEVELSLIHI